MQNIRIMVGGVTLDAELNDSPTAREIASRLPLQAAFNTWGDEIYFGVPVQAELDDTAREEVEMGDIGYWPTGQAFCIFFGPTPMSEPGRIIPASAVNIIGKVQGDAARLKGALSAGEVRVEAA